MRKLFFLFLTFILISFLPALSQEERPEELTRTEEHIREYCSLIELIFPGATKSDEAIECIDRERKLIKTHLALYHGQDGTMGLLVELNKKIYLSLARALLGNDAPKELPFQFLRLLGSKNKDQSLNKFFTNNNTQRACDHHTEIGKKLLSVNLSLFGNIAFWIKYLSAECTYGYYKGNASFQPPDTQAMLSKLFTRFNFDQEHIAPLEKIISEEGKRSGALYQILMPIDDVNRLAYPACPGGAPLERYYDCGNEKEFTKILSYTKEGKSVSLPSPRDMLDYFQGRVLFTQDGLCNPYGNIKIYKYQTIQDATHKKLDYLAHDIVKETLAKGNYSESLVELCDGILKNRQVLGVAESQPPSVDSDKKYAAYKQKCSHMIQLRKKQLLTLGHCGQSHKKPTQAVTGTINVPFKN